MNQIKFLKKSNKTWKISFTKPAITWYLMQAAGISRGSMVPGIFIICFKYDRQNLNQTEL